MSLGVTKREKRKKEWRERREIVKAKKNERKKENDLAGWGASS